MTYYNQEVVEKVVIGDSSYENYTSIDEDLAVVREGAQEAKIYCSPHNANVLRWDGASDTAGVTLQYQVLEEECFYRALSREVMVEGKNKRVRVILEQRYEELDLFRFLNQHLQLENFSFSSY